VTIDVFERYAALDPANSPGIQPEWSTMAPVPLSTLDGREPDMQTQQQTPKQPRPPRKRRTGLLVAATAVALVLIVGAVALLNSGSDSNLAPSATATPPADTDTSVSTSDALAVSNAYLVAYNAGNVDDVMALYAPGALFYDNLSGQLVVAEGDEERMNLTSDAFQDTKLTSEGCTATAGDQGRATSVLCNAAIYDALAQAIDATPVPAQIEMKVTASGITYIGYTMSDPDFLRLGIPFVSWMEANNPTDAAKIIFGSWTTVEEAREYGELRARYAKEWATYLADNNCTYQDDC